MGKLTKKQLQVLDRGEIRKLAIVSMGLPAVESYRMTGAEIVSWVYQNRKLLHDINIEELERPLVKDGTSGFRDGVIEYIDGLRRYVGGEGDAPVLGEHAETTEEVEPAEEETQEPEATEEEVEETPEEAPEPVKEEEEKPVKKPPVKLAKKKKLKKAATPKEEPPVAEKTSLKKVSFGKKGNGGECCSQRELEQITEELCSLRKELGYRADTLDDGVDNLIRRVDDIETRISDIENALLYILNFSLLDDGAEVTSLTDLDSPSDYLG